MEHLTDFRGLSALIGGLLALIVIGIVVVRFLRKREPRAPLEPDMPDVPGEGNDPAFLDSSHILNRPMPGAKDRAGRAGSRGGEGGGGSGTGRGGTK
jgi:hypothetical protein